MKITKTYLKQIIKEELENYYKTFQVGDGQPAASTREIQSAFRKFQRPYLMLTSPKKKQKYDKQLYQAAVEYKQGNPEATVHPQLGLKLDDQSIANLKNLSMGKLPQGQAAAKGRDQEQASPSAQEKAPKSSPQKRQAAKQRKQSRQQRAQSPRRKADALRTKPVQGKILTTQSITNRLKAAGIDDKAVTKQVNDIVKNWIQKALQSSGNQNVRIFEQVNLTVGANSLLKRLEKAMQLRRSKGEPAVPTSVLQQILKDIEMQLKSNEIQVIQSKKQLQGKQTADPEAATQAAGNSPGKVSPEEASDIVDATAIRTKSLAPTRDAGAKQKMVRNVKKAGDEGIQWLQNYDKLDKAQPEDVVARQVANSKTYRGTKPEQQAIMTKGVNRAGRDAIAYLKNKGKLDEALESKAERIYEALIRKINQKH